MAEAGSGSAFSLEVRRRFAARRERVYRAWTEAEALKRWYAPVDAEVALAEVELRVGGRWRVHMLGADGQEHRVSGEYREITPPRRLVFTWHWEHQPEDHVMVVTVEFNEAGSETELVLRHEGFRNEEERNGHEQGWHGLFAKLAEQVEQTG